MKAVYNLSNLEETLKLPKPARLAVLGFPVKHSASPPLHQHALDAFSINASYIRLEVLPGEIGRAFQLMADLDFIGCNITVPHKFEAISECTSISHEASVMGAVNTVAFRNNEIHGTNTDGPGFLRAIQQAFQISCSHVHTLILGAGGGAGQAIAAQCALAKAPALTLVNRTMDKIETLAYRISEISPETRITTISLDDPGLMAACQKADLLVQTSSLGLAPSDPPILSDECFQAHHCAYDTIYQPPETPFLSSARKKGCRTQNGLSLLIHQGALAFQYWFPDTEPLPHMIRAMDQAASAL